MHFVEHDKRIQESRIINLEEDEISSQRREFANKSKQLKKERIQELQNKSVVFPNMNNLLEVDDIDIDQDIDNMPDCRLKYQIIMKRAKAGKGKFNDAQFTASNESIGDDLL